MEHLAKAHVVLALVMVVEGCGSSNTNDSKNPSQGGTAGGGGTGAGGGPSGGAAGAAGAGGSAGATTCHGKDDQGPCTTSAAVSCPDIGQEMTWLCTDEINGFVELKNSSDGRTYWCTVSFDKPDGFDCKTDVSPGLSQAITSGGNPTGSCPCDSNFALGFPNCTYECKARE